MNTGRVNPKRHLEDQGITGLASVYYNLPEAALIEAALTRGEGKLGNGGALLVSTGKFTGRSPKDKHVVRTPGVEDKIWWENNAAMSETGFDALYADMLEHMKGRDYFVQDLFGTRLAFALHPPPAAAARCRRTRRLRAGVHDHQCADVPRDA